MKLFILYSIVCMMHVTSPKVYPPELDIIKDIFFGAPIENADSTVFNFFKNNDRFLYEKKKGDYQLLYQGNKYTMWLYNFYFKQHPLVGNSFDTGMVGFNSSDFPGAEEVFDISLDLKYKDTAEARKAYIILALKFNKLEEMAASDTENIFTCNVEGFEDFKNLFVTFSKETSLGRTHYIAELRGTDGSF
jgi:hypothetical protein